MVGGTAIVRTSKLTWVWTSWLTLCKLGCGWLDKCRTQFCSFLRYQKSERENLDKMGARKSSWIFQKYLFTMSCTQPKSIFMFLSGLLQQIGEDWRHFDLGEDLESPKTSSSFWSAGRVSNHFYFLFSLHITLKVALSAQRWFSLKRSNPSEVQEEGDSEGDQQELRPPFPLLPLPQLRPGQVQRHGEDEAAREGAEGEGKGGQESSNGLRHRWNSFEVLF